MKFQMNSMFQSTAQAVSVLALGLGLSACMQVKQAVAPINEPVQALPLQEFDISDLADESGELALRSNRIFLWRDDVTPEQVASTLETSRELDRLEETRPSLDKRIKRIEDQFAGEFTEESSLELAIRKSVKKVERAQKALAVEQAKSESERDAVKLADLQSKLDAARNEEAQNRSSLEDLYQRGGFGEARRSREEAQVELATIEQNIQDRVAALDRDVEYFQQPPTLVRFRFPKTLAGDFDPSAAISAKFEGWKLPGEAEARTYSTDDSSIQDLVFKRRGGVLTFKIVVYADATLSIADAQGQGLEPSDSYCFRLVRNRYDQIGKDPRKFFGGEVFQIQGATDTCDPTELKTRAKDDASFRMRQGVVKMQDKASRE